jgi:TadE-like protein
MKIRKEHRRNHTLRGAALVETALVVGVILVMVLGAVQVGVIGYLQMSADAASFLNAHQNVIGVSSGDPGAATSQVFPQFNSTTNITTTVLPAPSPTIYVDYGYNDADPTIAAGSSVNRHGGASIMEPSQMQSTVSKSNVATILGIPIGVSGSMIEPQWLENGAHFDVANDNYGNVAANMQVNYFTNGENVPPYFVGFNEVEHCMSNLPWNSATPCPVGTATAPPQDFEALGVAEHLDDSNWSIPINQGGSAVSGTWGGTAAGGADASTFTEMACHQRNFAIVSTFLVNHPTLSGIQTSYPTLLTVGLQHNATGTEPDGTIGPMPIFSGFGQSGAPGFDAATSTAISTIYTWDREINGGYPSPGTYSGPGAAPLYAWYGC